VQVQQAKDSVTLRTLRSNQFLAAGMRAGEQAFTGQADEETNVPQAVSVVAKVGPPPAAAPD
jgi:hypothetical protein